MYLFASVLATGNSGRLVSAILAEGELRPERFGVSPCSAD